jgi:hypothetical protein
MIKEYCHPELGKEVAAPAGYYVPLEEKTLMFKGKKVLYTLGETCINSSCCGLGNWNYIQVPGYLVDEPVAGDQPTPLISKIETIQDENERLQITRLLQGKYPYARIEIC